MSHRYLHYSMALLMSMFTAVGMLAVPLLATQIGVSDLELGIIGSAAAGTYALVVVTAGTLSDRLGRKRVIVAGALLTGFAYTLMPLSKTPMHLIMLNAVCGCGLASFWPVLEAWMSEEGGAEEIRKELGAFNVSWSIGVSVGPLIAGLIYTRSSLLTFLVAAGGTAIVALMAALHKKPDALSTLSAAEKVVEFDRNEVRPVTRQLLYCAWIANFASWLAITQIRVLFPKLGLELGMQPWVIGIIIFSLGVALTIAFFFMAVYGRWHNKAAPLLCAQALIVILLLVSIRFESPFMIGLIFAGLGIGFGVTYSYSLYCSVVGTLNKGAASGRHEMVLGIGALLGPLIGGAAIQMFSAPRAPYVFAAGLVVACIIAEAVVLLRGRTR